MISPEASEKLRQLIERTHKERLDAAMLVILRHMIHQGEVPDQVAAEALGLTLAEFRRLLADSSQHVGPLRLFTKLTTIAEKVPQEARQALPPDVLENHDHYLYGLPKRTK